MKDNCSSSVVQRYHTVGHPDLGQRFSPLPFVRTLYNWLVQFYIQVVTF